MYIKRKIDEALKDWKNDPSHKPLLLRGARQTGKTTAVRHLAKGRNMNSRMMVARAGGEPLRGGCGL